MLEFPDSFDELLEDILVELICDSFNNKTDLQSYCSQAELRLYDEQPLYLCLSIAECKSYLTNSLAYKQLLAHKQSTAHKQSAAYKQSLAYKQSSAHDQFSQLDDKDYIVVAIRGLSQIEYMAPDLIGLESLQDADISFCGYYQAQTNQLHCNDDERILVLPSNNRTEGSIFLYSPYELSTELLSDKLKEINDLLDNCLDKLESKERMYELARIKRRSPYSLQLPFYIDFENLEPQFQHEAALIASLFALYLDPLGLKQIFPTKDLRFDRDLLEVLNNSESYNPQFVEFFDKLFKLMDQAHENPQIEAGLVPFTIAQGEHNCSLKEVPGAPRTLLLERLSHEIWASLLAQESLRSYNDSDKNAVKKADHLYQAALLMHLCSPHHYFDNKAFEVLAEEFDAYDPQDLIARLEAGLAYRQDTDSKEYDSDNSTNKDDSANRDKKDDSNNNDNDNSDNSDNSGNSRNNDNSYNSHNSRNNEDSAEHKERKLQRAALAFMLFTRDYASREDEQIFALHTDYELDFGACLPTLPRQNNLLFLDDGAYFSLDLELAWPQVLLGKKTFEELKDSKRLQQAYLNYALSLCFKEVFSLRACSFHIQHFYISLHAPSSLQYEDATYLIARKHPTSPVILRMEIDLDSKASWPMQYLHPEFYAQGSAMQASARQDKSNDNDLQNLVQHLEQRIQVLQINHSAFDFICSKQAEELSPIDYALVLQDFDEAPQSFMDCSKLFIQKKAERAAFNKEFEALFKQEGELSILDELLLDLTASTLNPQQEKDLQRCAQLYLQALDLNKEDADEGLAITIFRDFERCYQEIYERSLLPLCSSQEGSYRALCFANILELALFKKNWSAGCAIKLIDPRIGKFLNMYGQLLTKFEEYEQAQELYSWLNVIYPANPVSYLELSGYCDLDKADQKKLFEELLEAARCCSFSEDLVAWYYLKLCQYYIHEERYQEASLACMRAASYPLPPQELDLLWHYEEFLSQNLDEDLFNLDEEKIEVYVDSYQIPRIPLIQDIEYLTKLFGESYIRGYWDSCHHLLDALGPYLKEERLSQLYRMLPHIDFKDILCGDLGNTNFGRH